VKQEIEKKKKKKLMEVLFKIGVATSRRIQAE
jgi:hypothetical protein